MPEKMKILMVEDRKVDRRLLRKILEGKGYDVREAANGQEGLNILQLHRPDLIISDALMPEMDGFSFLRKISKDAELKTIPFIFYTASYLEEKDKKLAFALGALSYIEKPSPPEEFLEKLQVIIQQIEVTEQPVQAELIEEEEEYLRKYSDIIATKLEDMVEELEKVNKKLLVEIEERKKVTEELKNHREHLEKKVRERTEELQTFVNAMAGREVRMAELKKENRKLREQLKKAGIVSKENQ